MKIALFGGSFDPVHSEHLRLVEAAHRALGLDKVVVIPSFLAPHKAQGAFAAGEERLEMCRLAFRKLPYAEVSGFELEARGTSYSYLTCRYFAEKYRGDKLYFLVGADMLENFFSWKNPDDILKHVTLAACGRGGETPVTFRERFEERFGCSFETVPFTGGEVSSTRIRTELAFGYVPQEIPPEAIVYIRERGLYSHPAILPALALEKKERQEHSFRVALLAAERCRGIGVSEKKAILASALHDCAKYVPADSPMLERFVPPENVPAPVLHQYTGAYLAEHYFGIDDEEVLDAIRFHTSGRADMTVLGKLILLADTLESGRDFEGVEELRAAFFRDIDECLLLTLRRQTEYLKASGKPVYPLTEEAYRWAEEHISG